MRLRQCKILPQGWNQDLKGQQSQEQEEDFSIGLVEHLMSEKKQVRWQLTDFILIAYFVK